jgi:hypothetical protein
MKTYKFLAVALVATGFFSACTNEEVVQPVNVNAPAEISFRLQGGSPETRATATTTANIQALVVYGADFDGTTNTLLFDGTTVARQKDNSFAYAPKKYYSAGASAAGFVAYSPVSAKVSNPTAAANLRTAGASFEYEVLPPDGTGDAVQEDLLVTGINLATIDATPVSLNFTHALSRIFVKATNSLTDNVVITGLTLKGLNSTGTITGSPATAWGWAWSVQDDPIDYIYTLATSGVAVKAGVTPATLVTSMEQGMLILPQTTPADDSDDVYDTGEFALEVTYDVGNVIGEKKLVFPAPMTFELNKQYAITIDFVGTDLIEIKFSVTVSDFDALP